MDIFDHPKIKPLLKNAAGRDMVYAWTRLITMAVRRNEAGLIRIAKGVPYTEDELAAYMELPLKRMRDALAYFERTKMIVRNEEGILLPGFDEYQNIEGLERKKELDRNRSKRYRKKMRDSQTNSGESEADANGAEISGVTLPSRDGNVTVTLRSRDCHATDKIREDKNRTEEKRGEETGAKAVPPEGGPPTPDEVRAYCIQRGNGIDADRFVDFYQAKGWYIGQNKMKDWRAAVRAWEKKQGPAGAAFAVPAAESVPRQPLADSVPRHGDRIYITNGPAGRNEEGTYS